MNWHAVFWVNIPICIVTITLDFWGIPADKLSEKKASLDVELLINLKQIKQDLVLIENGELRLVGN